MKIKPLEWRIPENDELGKDGTILTADGIGGSFDIQKSAIDGYLLWYADDAFFWEMFDTLDAAKAEAERIWQESIAAVIEL